MKGRATEELCADVVIGSLIKEALEQDAKAVAEEALEIDEMEDDVLSLCGQSDEVRL